jgi:hypothetical protein
MSWWRVKSLLLALAVSACGSVYPSRVDGGGDGSVGSRPPGPPKTGSVPLPQSGDKPLPLWLSAGGGSATGASTQAGVTMGALSPAASVAAPNGSTVALGHFVDGLE